ncbi:uncharacterized protein EI90DRAFT_3120861 [Cantharellus anzutake]|uniref:uncharacterized protein n=1 Tax=Cantharellus anzutake TaxID=1750568 RepID=UPI00190806DB|nr:uncharacterized protein EI90DRAFT_3120861 [Cantharellus anzutake]KAF8334990.1 hypothetical protein EI90DRAFT_3120861 [Cantharellus anzutake]
MASALSRSTTSRVTADFNHLKNIRGPTGVYRSPARKRNPLAAKPLDAHPKDRIKWWNIVPGDRVRLVRGPYKDSNRIVEVLSINKYRNIAMFKDLSYPKKKNDPDAPAMPVQAHYSNLQLYMGKRSSHQNPTLTLGVFATRIHMTNPRYDIRQQRWMWDRYAAATSPILPGLQGEGGRRRRVTLSEAESIPWPEIPRKQYPPANLHDTSKNAVNTVTWKPMPPNVNPLTREILPPDVSATSVNFEETYIQALLQNRLSNLSPSLPMEIYLHEELSNPHSRAKKQKRWQVRMKAKEEERSEMIRKEMLDLRGRKRAVARREAIFRWNAKMKHDGKEARYRRWVQRGGLERTSKRSIRKARKGERRLRRLRNLVLQVGTKNQVVPGVETKTN